MQIGLSLNSTLPGDGESPSALAPLPGILDAPNVVILGASLMNGAFGGLSDPSPEIRAYAAALGFTGTLHSYAVSGYKVAQTIERHALAAADLAATEGANLYIVHTGGNNVSGPRPYPGGADVFQADYDTLMANITAADPVIPLPLTKRLYVDPPVVLQDDPATEANGSKPYNEAIIYPAITENAPDWMGDGSPYVDPYDFLDTNLTDRPFLLGADGIHGSGHTLAHYILARVAGRALGITRGSRAGKALVLSLEQGLPKEYLPGAVANRLTPYKINAGSYNPFWTGALFADGTLDPFVQIEAQNDFSGQKYWGVDSADKPAGLEARVPDPRLRADAALERAIYVSGAQVFRLVVDGLHPGDMVTVKAACALDYTNSVRTGDLTLNEGETLTLETRTDTALNQVDFAPIPVPANGRLTLDLSVADGASYGYLAAVLLDFI